MFKGLINRINSVRYGDLALRKKWFLWVSAVCFVLVVIIWFFSISNLFSGQTNNTQNEVPSQVISDNDFFQIIKNGAKKIFSSIINWFGTTKEIIIENKN